MALPAGTSGTAGQGAPMQVPSDLQHLLHTLPATGSQPRELHSLPGEALCCCCGSMPLLSLLRCDR
jgi:hypothetical protein